MLNKFFLFWFLVLQSQISYAQYSAKSSTQPLPFSTATTYVVIPTSGFKATHVKTTRSRTGGKERLDLINIIIPEALVLQNLVASHDIGTTGLFVHDELLVTMAVLPDHTTHQVAWIKVQVDTIPDKQRIDWYLIAKDCYTRLFNYKAVGGPAIDNSRRRLDLRPVIKQDGQYYTTRQTVLTEYYVLRNYPTWFPTTGDNATINCLAKPFSPTDYAKAVTEDAGQANQTPQAYRLSSELGTNLLLQKVEKDIYTFWSLTPTIADAGIAEFGAGDLQFKPGVGLICGKYAAYFESSGSSAINNFFEVITILSLNSK
jgi:hypothetical protein